MSKTDYVDELTAPDLLGALVDLEMVTRPSKTWTDAEVRDLESRYRDDTTWSELVAEVRSRARAAIAKARGES